MGARAPMGMQSPVNVCYRTGQPVYWKYGGNGHLRRSLIEIMMRMPTRAQGTSNSWCEEGETSVINLVPLFYTQHTSQEEYLQPVTEDLIGTSHDW
jgi:hypothetical protein